MVIPHAPSSSDAARSSLLRGYQPKAKALWWVLVTVGAYVVLQASWAILHGPTGSLAMTMLSLALTGLSAAFPIRSGKQRIAFTFGDFYVLLTLYANGVSAAILAAAVEGYIGAARVSTRRMANRIVSPAIQAICMLAAGNVYDSLAKVPWFSADRLATGMGAAVVGGLAFAIGLSILVPAIPALNRKSRPNLVMAGAYVTSVVVTSIVASTIAFVFRDSPALAMFASVPLVAATIAFVHLLRNHAQETLDSQRRETDAWKSSANASAAQIQELRMSERQLQDAFRNAAVGAALLQLDGTIRQANRALCELLHRTESSLIDTNLASYVGEPDREVWRRHLRRVERDSTSQFSTELRFDRADGASLWLGLHGSPITDPRTGQPNLVLYAHDNTSRRQAELGLKHIAEHDPLTGLPNRRRLNEVLTHFMNASRSSSNQSFTVMFVDFDGFKAINDKFGHATGDQFLVEMASRLSASVRPGDVVGRLGGDEFVILVATPKGPEQAALASLANRIIENLASPFVLSGTEVSASASIGIAVDASGYDSAEEMIQDADSAMYRAKEGGKRRFAFAPKRRQ